MTIIHIISSFGRGGRERQLSSIYKYSNARKLKTKIICFNPSESNYFEEYGMAKDVLYLKSTSIIDRYFELKKIVLNENGQIIWTWGGLEATYGLIINLLLKIKHINGSIRHGIVIFNFNQIWRMCILHLSRNIVANSKAGLYSNHLHRGRVLYNGIDIKFFECPEIKEKIREKFLVNINMVLLISVANLVPYKDYVTIFKALFSIKKKGLPFHYFIAGEGPERSNIEKLINELGLIKEISLLGSRTDIKELLNSADIFIHSSRGEGCSNAILEAMASGLPVIATNTGGTSEIVDSTVGRLFEFKNVDQLTGMLIELITDVEKRKSLGQNARHKILENFTISKMMDEYYHIVQQVLNT